MAALLWEVMRCEDGSLRPEILSTGGSLLQPHMPPPHCLSVSYMPLLTPIQSENRLDRGLKQLHSSIFRLCVVVVSRLHDRFRECLSSSETADLLIGEIVQLRIKLSCVRPLQFSQVEISGLDDAKFYQFPFISFSLSAHNSMKGMINFTSQAFPRQILYCSDRGKRKSKDSFSDQTKNDLCQLVVSIWWVHCLAGWAVGRWLFTCCYALTNCVEVITMVSRALDDEFMWLETWQSLTNYLWAANGQSKRRSELGQYMQSCGHNMQ